jgi:hypothetical protein
MTSLEMVKILNLGRKNSMKKMIKRRKKTFRNLLKINTQGGS